MNSGLTFLLAARRCEIAELEQLAQASKLVGVIGRFTHELQRERGISSLFLGSKGARFARQRADQTVACETLEREVRACFDLLDTDTGRLRNGSRLFSRVALVLHALDALPAMRSRIAAHALTPPESTAAFTRTIAGLLAVVFEAADSAADPAISRALIAMFNFMQGKEFAGQERALGAAAFASGRVAPAVQHHWRHLIESQQGCFQVFAEFSETPVRATEQASQDPRTLGELERLRRIGGDAVAQETVDTHLSQTWYDCCTRRMDAMKSVEELLAANLRGLCERKIGEASKELRDQQALLTQAASRQEGEHGPGAPAHYGPRLDRFVLSLLQEQSLRLQSMSDELDTLRGTLNERKVVERAKGLLMAHRQLTEEEAYKALRQMAMNQKRRLAEVAQAVLSMAEVLSAAPR